MIVTTESYDIALLKNMIGTAPGGVGGSVTFSHAVTGHLEPVSGVGYHPVAPGFTAQGWFNFAADVTTGINYPIVSVWDQSSPQRSWALAITGPLPYGRLSPDGATSTDLSDPSTPVPTVGSWHLCSIVWDGTAVFALTRDGVQVNSAPAYGATVFNSTSMIRVGAWMGATAPITFSGSIMGVRIWTRALTPAELTTMYNGGHYLSNAALPAGLKTGLLHDWSLTEPVPGPFVDLGSGAANLTPVGTVTQGPPGP